MRLSICNQDVELAYTTRWKESEFRGHLLIAIPRLRLSHETALRVPHAGYSGALSGTLRTPTREISKFLIIHASLSTYVNGEPDLIDFAVLVPSEGVALPPVPAVISAAARLLRSED